MNKELLASLLNGNEYGNEMNDEQALIAKENNLVVVHGASDDLMIMRGAIDDEFGTEVYFDAKGIIGNDCHNEDCPCFIKRKSAGKLVEGVFGPKGRNISWEIRTEIPHSKFIIMEDGEEFCEGIVFSLDDLG